jgi:alpha-glucosidase
MFAYRHDMLKALIADGLKLVVLAPDERISHLPEYKKLGDATGFDATSRFLDYDPRLKILTVSEENIMSDPAQPLAGDSQVIRVMATAVYHVTAKRPVDPNWETRPRNLWQQYELHVQRLDERLDHSLEQLLANATAKGMWKGTAVHNRADYFVQGVLAYFDAAGQSLPPSDAQQSIVTREALRQYDPELFSLISQTMAYDGHVDWRLPRHAADR